AAPLFNREGKVLGSLGTAMSASTADRSQFPALTQAVMKAAHEATERIRSGKHGVDLPARAIGCRLLWGDSKNEHPAALAASWDEDGRPGRVSPFEISMGLNRVREGVTAPKCDLHGP